MYSFLLNAQGHNQGDLVAYNRGDYVLVTTDREQAPKIAAIFDRYIIMDNVEVADISDKLASIGVAGPKAREILTAAGIDVAQLDAGQVIDAVWHDIGISVARSTQPQMDGYEIWFAAGERRQVWDAWTRRRHAGRQRCAGDRIASCAACRVTAWICASAICRRKPDRSTR